MKASKVFVAGHRGLVGSAIVRALLDQGYDSRSILKRTRAELDLSDAKAVANFFASEKPSMVYLAAARVGGIGANNTFPADFIRENLAIQTNVIESAHASGTARVLF